MGFGRGALLWLLGFRFRSSFCLRCSGITDRQEAYQRGLRSRARTRPLSRVVRDVDQLSRAGHRDPARRKATYLFWSRPVNTSATASSAAVTMSCLGPRPGAVRAISDTNCGSIASCCGGGGGGRRRKTSGRKARSASTSATAARISEAASGPCSGSSQKNSAANRPAIGEEDENAARQREGGRNGRASHRRLRLRLGERDNLVYHRRSIRASAARGAVPR